MLAHNGDLSPDGAVAPRVLKHGRIKQSLAYWCLNATEWKWTSIAYA
jgi:hypothetical protein